MFEIYALTAGIVLPTGIVTLAYFLYQSNKVTKNPNVWTWIFESLATVWLGVFYLSSAIILSRTYSNNSSIELDSMLQDMAIVNDTLYGNVGELETVNHHPSFDINNEIEDTRNNKNKEFLQFYQNLVQTSLHKKTQDPSKETRKLNYRMLEPDRNPQENLVEDQDCFLKNFLYQALLVYSFITSVLSLLNTCFNCQQCSESKTQKDNSAESNIKSPQVSDNFGEKIEANSTGSTEIETPVGPLFEISGKTSSSRNLEVFSVKNTSQIETSHEDIMEFKHLKLKNIAKGSTFIILPHILVIILYFLMKNESEGDNFLIPDLHFDFNFNNTVSNVKSENYVTVLNESDPTQQEIAMVLRRVYKIIQEFSQETDRKTPIPTIQYLNKFKTGNVLNTTECFQDKISLKTYQLTILLLPFIFTIFYTKLSEVKLPKSGNLHKCLIAFLTTWLPGMIEILYSRLLNHRQPDIISALLLLWGNFDRLYAAKKNIAMFKSNSFVDPSSG